MKKQILVLLSSMFLLAAAAFAHGEMQHVMGTVTKISNDSITVKTKTEAAVTITMTADTKFMKGDSAVKITDLKVGDKVVIEAKKDDKDATRLVAHMVKIGQMSRMAHHEQHELHN